MRSVLRALCVGFVASLAALVTGCASSTRKPIAPPEVSDDSAVVARIPLGGPPNAVAVTPDGSRAYAAAAGKVFIIDTASNSAVNSIPLPHHPAAIAISADGSHAYVADFFPAGFWVIDTTAGRVTTTVDIGPTRAQVPALPAVAVEDGLVAPVVRGCQHLSLRAIAQATNDLVQKAQAGRFGGEALTGATFTLSNMGMLDVEEFSAVITPPQAAILAVGAIKERPVVRDGQIAVAKTVRVTLSVDHRVLTGVEAARFLEDFKRVLENPLALMLGPE